MWVFLLHRRWHRARPRVPAPVPGDRRAWSSRRSTCRSALLIWVMIVPMLLKVDFGALHEVKQHCARHRRDAVRQLGGQAVLDGAARLDLHPPRVRAAGCRPGQLDSYVAGPDPARGRTLHGDGVRVEPASPAATRTSRCRRWRSTTRSWCSPSRRSSACCSASPAITVPWDTLLTSVVLYIVIPVVVRAALAARAAAQAWPAALDRGARDACIPLSIAALLATLVLLFGSRAGQILAQPLVIAMLAVPILIQVYFNATLAYWLNRRLGDRALRRLPVGADRRQQLLRARGRRGDQPVRLRIRRCARDRGRRADRGAGDAVGGAPGGTHPVLVREQDCDLIVQRVQRRCAAAAAAQAAARRRRGW